MQELTEREQKLIGFLKVKINFMTVWGIYEQKVIELRNWAFDSMAAAGANTEWQNEMLHYLEEQFGLKYSMLNDKGEPLEEKDGKQD